MSVIVARSPGNGGGSTSSGPVSSYHIVIGVTETAFVDAAPLTLFIGLKWLVTIQTQNDLACAYEVNALAMPLGSVQFSIGAVLGDPVMHEVDVIIDTNDNAMKLQVANDEPTQLTVAVTRIGVSR